MLETIEEILKSGDISNYMLFASFFGGVLSSISPCTLAILPLIIGYIGLDEEKNYKKTFLKISALVLGLATVMTCVGIFSALSGNIFMAFGGDLWIIIIASLIMIFGLNILGIIDIEFQSLIKRMPKKFEKHEFLYAYIIGVLFAFATTPCATPILAAILSYASITKKILYSGLMLFLFSIGQGLILILAALFTTFIKKMHKLQILYEILFKLSGILLILLALYLWWGTIFAT